MDFTSPAGEPSLLGNSVTEAGFVPTASCITCHSRAALSPAGGPLEMFGRQDPPLGYTGSPDPAWFRDTSAAREAPSSRTDFLWQFPFIPRIVADNRSQDGE